MDHFGFRMNGTGNAWPVPLGRTHPFYSGPHGHDYSNASYTVFFREGEVSCEILVDAGHGIIPFLLNNGNRIPDAVVISHPHFDHVLGLDYIVQSHYRFREKSPYPVFASPACWKAVLRIMPQLEEAVEFHGLRPAEPVHPVAGTSLRLCFYPVYHGKSAPGAGMLHFRTDRQGNSRSILFTGDLLCPLLRKKDLGHLKHTAFLVADANNRFPYPRTNHWSIVPDTEGRKPYFNDWLAGLNTSAAIEAHSAPCGTDQSLGYFDQISADSGEKPVQAFSVTALVKEIEPGTVLFVHYSGAEDEKYYGQEILNRQQLSSWLGKVRKKEGISSKFIVPAAGDQFWL